MSNTSKQTIRKHCLDIRRALPLPYQEQASLQVCERIMTLPQYQQATHIAYYQATQGEIDLKNLWQAALSQHKKCYFPIQHQDNTLSFLPANEMTLFRPNRYHILEPDVDLNLAIPVEQLDLMLIPLVAFDNACHRIGMGSGCYDKTLARNRHPLLLGVAYDFQRQVSVETDSWDIILDSVITEKNLYWRST